VAVGPVTCWLQAVQGVRYAVPHVIMSATAPASSSRPAPPRRRLLHQFDREATGRGWRPPGTYSCFMSRPVRQPRLVDPDGSVHGSMAFSLPKGALKQRHTRAKDEGGWLAPPSLLGTSQRGVAAPRG
jgi:hypothetical protein